ncbi:MAG: 16S rRNA (uracil(1498)-N(3))-methyltransferase [Bacteroidales bacterium]|jgi:16S rRNA (uracil1498-N3)-methyltransferase|nr:16S rRNA (uracil(1498)-N(3))-methyltransferase [Bacteroidales bacterium]
MYLFYSSTPIASVHVLDEQESRHCIKSLRLQTGDEVHITDGKGNLYKAEMIDNNSKACVLKVMSKVEDYKRLPYYLHIAVSPTKNTDRIAWFVEKAVEIGISEITTLICKHSERTQIKSDRIERLMISAMKQSLHIDLPAFSACIRFDDFLQKTQAISAQKFIAFCGNVEQTPVLLQTVCAPKTDTYILIGPEGDFTAEEVRRAVDCGYVVVSLGEFRLRTETAAIHACSTVRIINDEQEDKC